MDEQTVEKLEKKLEHAIRQLFDELAGKRPPRPPRNRTAHLMAKAAVAVYEAVVDESRRKQ